MVTPQAVLTIGPYSTRNRVVLAPMAGVTDQPFRNLCLRLGGDLCVSEMVTSDARLWDTLETRNRLRFDDGRTRWVQIAGGDPLMMADAARRNVDLGADIIDLNMGCPAKKVCRKMAGSSLLKDEKLVADIIAKVVASVSVPVTLKMRTGWSPERKNGLAVAKIAENEGIQCISVHGRTRACRFNGDAEYETVTRIKDAVSIPVLANGDIDSAHKAALVMRATGVDGLMIGRAAQGNPWLIGEIHQFLDSGRLPMERSLEERKTVLMAHIKELHQFYGEGKGVRIARKHLGWYLRKQTEAGAFRHRFNRLDEGQAQLDSIESYFEELNMEDLAA